MEKETVIEMHQSLMDGGVETANTAPPKRGTDIFDDVDDSGFFTKAARALIIGLVSVISVLLFPITIFMSVRVVRQYERAVLFRLGKLAGKTAKGPGMFFTVPFLDSIVVVDLRTKTMDIPKQEVLTKDSVTIQVDAVLYSRIFDPILSVIKVENAETATRLLGATTLRNTVATLTLSEFLTSREKIANKMRLELDIITDNWGLKLERVEITDVKLPLQMQRAMAAEAEADRDAKAKIIAAEGERQASTAIKQAADVLANSPGAIQLRYLQTLNAISAENNSTIVFPIPIDFLRVFGQNRENPQF